MKLANLTSAYRAKLIINTYQDWIKNNKKVLDIGCGTGVVGKEIKKIYKVQISGCDIDKYLLYNMPFKKIINEDKLPYKNASFDYAMFNDVLHHTEYKNQKKLLLESLRVAKTVLVFELKPTLMGKLFDYLLNKFHNLHMYIPFTYRSQKSWEKLLKEAKISYQIKQVPKPFWYPFTHIAYKLVKK